MLRLWYITTRKAAIMDTAGMWESVFEVVSFIFLVFFFNDSFLSLCFEVGIKKNIKKRNIKTLQIQKKKKHFSSYAQWETRNEMAKIQKHISTKVASLSWYECVNIINIYFFMGVLFSCFFWFLIFISIFRLRWKNKHLLWTTNIMTAQERK